MPMGDCRKEPALDKRTLTNSLNIPSATRAGYDLDGLHGRMKWSLDAIAKMWVVNDKNFRPVLLDFGEPVKGGKVVFRVGVDA